MKKKLRLQAFLASAQIASRRASEELILDGRVRVNDNIITELGYKVSKEDKIYFDDKRVYVDKKKVYILLNKPKYFICSNKDDENRELAIDLVQPYFSQRLFSAGRLDYLSSGLILFSNDGDFCNKISHPKNKIEKEYMIYCQKELPRELLSSYKEGLIIDRVKYKLNRYKMINRKIAHLVLTEGKNREIRKVFNYFKVTIRNLERTRIGHLKLDHDLKVGRYRLLNDDEIKQFNEQKK